MWTDFVDLTSLSSSSSSSSSSRKGEQREGVAYGLLACSFRCVLPFGK